MSKHTPTPWFINTHPFTNQGEYILARVGTTGDDIKDVVRIAIIEKGKNVFQGSRTKEETLANARRIIECVHAMEGIEQPRVARLAIDGLIDSTKAMVNEERERCARLAENNCYQYHPIQAMIPVREVNDKINYVCKIIAHLIRTGTR